MPVLPEISVVEVVGQIVWWHMSGWNTMSIATRWGVALVITLAKSGVFARPTGLDPKCTDGHYALGMHAITLASIQRSKLVSSSRTDFLCGPRWWMGTSGDGWETGT
jgi:hypothetical protein